MRSSVLNRPPVNISIGYEMCRFVEGESESRRGRMYESSTGEKMLARDAETWTAVDRLRASRFLGEREFSPHILDSLERQGFSLVRQSGMVGFAETIAHRGDYIPA